MMGEQDRLHTQLDTLISTQFDNRADIDLSSSMTLSVISDIDFNVSKTEQSVIDENFNAEKFNGHIEQNWWLSSFSSLTRNLRHGGLSLPDRDQDINVSEKHGDIYSTDLRFTLIKGASAGNLLHNILEYLDFGSPDWQRAIVRPLSRFSDTMVVEDDELISWLLSCLEAPLNNSSRQKLNLAQLKWSDTLREVEFYFPMQSLKLHALSRLLSDYRGYTGETSVLNLPGYQVLEGMMHGFIDLVFQWQGQFFIADYKSTWLGNSIDCYGHNELQTNIRDNFYDLQYLLYSLALHRYLKNRLDDYQPEKHFGGVYYLYLRGMNRHSGSGIFYSSIDAVLLDKLDSLFSYHKTEEKACE